MQEPLLMSSHFLHFQRTVLVHHRSVLVGGSGALVAIASEGTTLHDSSVTLVVLDEVLERERLASILLDALDDALTTDGIIIRDVVVHTRVGLGTEDTTVVHESTLVDVHDVAVSLVIDEVAPIHAVHLAGEREVVISS